jgi:hypothetical protein
VLFGGQGAQAMANDAWEWTGTAWLQRFPAASPPARIRLGLAYDPSREVVLMFGGQSSSASFADLWEYAPTNPASFAVFGAGCAGSSGVPTLGVAAGQRPWLGDAVTLLVANVPAGGAALIWLGLSRTAAGPFALPLALAFAGLPGCNLLASIDACSLPPISGGIASQAVPVPASVALLGAEFYCQGAVTDGSANAAGLVLSNAGVLRVGGR